MNPVFIGGCSRSGTTLLGAMLGYGPGAVAVPEAEFKWNLWSSGAVTDRGVHRDRAKRLLDADPKFGMWGVEAPTRLPEPATFESLLTHLVCDHAHAAGKPRPRRWTDHTPGNVRFFGTLHRHFSQARFVHLVRDGRAVAASVIPLDWGPNDAVEAATYWSTQL